MRGENEFNTAIELMCCLTVAKEAGWNIFGSVSFVMRSVFEGGAGELKPGSEDKSRDSDNGDLDLFFDNDPGEDVADAGGEVCKPLV